MKTFSLCLLVLTPAVAFAQLPPLQVTRFEVPGTLAWTNRLCPAQPVYEVLRADSLTGPWQRVGLVTNQTTLALPNPAAGAGFYRVAWVGEAQMEFNYSFDEGYGQPAITGSLRLGLLRSSSGTWTCHETAFAIEGRHPTGNGILNHGDAVVTPPDEHRLRGYFTPGGFGIEGAVFLEGVLQRGQVGGECGYVGITGTVFEVTFADTVAIGTFTATRVP